MLFRSPSKNTGVSCHFLLQGIFLIRGSNPHLLRWQADSLPSEPPGNPQNGTQRKPKVTSSSVLSRLDLQLLSKLHTKNNAEFLLSLLWLGLIVHENKGMTQQTRKISGETCCPSCPGMCLPVMSWMQSCCCLVAPDSLQPHGLRHAPGSSVHGISQARILEWVAISLSRGSS